MSIMLVTNIYVFKFYEFSYFVNVVNKIVLDEFYFSIFYYIWSNFSIMFILLTFIFYTIFIYKSHLYFSRFFSYLIFISILFFLNLLDYYFLNTYNFSNEFFLKNYNILLNNSINKFHPFLLYNAIYYLLLSFIVSNVYYNHTHLNSNFLNFSYTLSNSGFYLCVTLLLGSWWAFQEGSWGGWWDWDVSEVFGLFILISILRLTHCNFFSINDKNYLYRIGTHVYILFIFYLFMQLNFSLISHNFNLHPSSNFFTNVVYMSIFFLFLIKKKNLFTIEFKLFDNTILISKTKWGLNRYVAFKLCLFLFISLIILFSSFSIAINWLWVNFTINYSYKLIEFTQLMSLASVFLLILYWDFKLLYLTIFAFLSYSTIGIFLLLIRVSLLSLDLVHYFVYLCIWVAVLYHFTEVSYWNYLFFGFNETYYFIYNLIKVDSPTLNINKGLLDCHLTKSANFNWYYDFSTQDFKTFDLTMSGWGVSQNFIYDSEFNEFTTNLLSLMENLLLPLVLTSLIFSMHIKFKNIIIVF